MFPNFKFHIGQFFFFFQYSFSFFISFCISVGCYLSTHLFMTQTVIRVQQTELVSSQISEMNSVYCNKSFSTTTNC